MAKFKVGGKVDVRIGWRFHGGKNVRVTMVDAVDDEMTYRAVDDHGENLWIYNSDILGLSAEPVAVAPATATLKIGDHVVFVTDNPNGGAEFGRAGDKATVTEGPRDLGSHGTQVVVTSPCGGDVGPLVPVTALRLDEPAAVAEATAAFEIEFVPFPQDGVADLIPGVISAINQSPRGTNYNIVFETQNRRVSLHFLEEDFILDEDDADDGECICANNDNDPVRTGDTAKAFDALANSLFGLTVRRAA